MSVCVLGPSATSCMKGMHRDSMADRRPPSPMAPSQLPCVLSRSDLKTTNNTLIYSVTYSGIYIFPDIPRPDEHTLYSFYKSDTPRNLTRMIQNGKDIWFSSFTEGLFHWQEEGDTLIRKQRHFLGENFSDMDINKDNKIKRHI